MAIHTKKVILIILLVHVNSFALIGQSRIGKINSSITQYKMLKNNMVALEEKYNPIRDTCILKENSKEYQLMRIDNEMLVASNEFRQGYYCSQCNRPKSQIEREESVTFEQHLRKVNGKAIPFTEDQIAEALKPYQSKKDKIVNETKKACDVENQLRREISDKVTLSLMLQSEIINNFNIWKEEKAQKIKTLRQKAKNEIANDERKIELIKQEGEILLKKIIDISDIRDGMYIPKITIDTEEPAFKDANSNLEADHISQEYTERNQLIQNIKSVHNKLINAQKNNLSNHQQRIDEYKMLIREIDNEGVAIRKVADDTGIKFEYIENIENEHSKNLTEYYFQQAIEKELDTYENGYTGYKLGEALYSSFRSSYDLKYKQEQEIDSLDSKLSKRIGQYRLFINE